MKWFVIAVGVALVGGLYLAARDSPLVADIDNSKQAANAANAAGAN